MSGLVNEHVVCRSVRDSAGVLDAISGPMPAIPTRRRPRSERTSRGPDDDAAGGQVTTHPDCVAAALAAAARLGQLGHDVAYPKALDDPD